MVMIDVGDPKTAREMLCELQTHVVSSWMPENELYSRWLQTFIDYIDEVSAQLENENA